MTFEATENARAREKTASDEARTLLLADAFKEQPKSGSAAEDNREQAERKPADKKEVVFDDGSRRVEYASGGQETFDRSGLPTQMKTPDGVTRNFGWKKENGEAVLNSVSVVDANNKLYSWEKKGEDWFCNGQKEERQLSVDKQTGVYSYIGETVGKHVIAASGKEIATIGDTTIELQSDRTIKASNGDHSFEYTWDKDKITSIKESQGKDIRNWTSDGDKGWKSDRGDTIPGKPVPTATGQPNFLEGEKVVEVGFDGQVTRVVVDQKTMAITRVSETRVESLSEKGTVHQYKLDDDGKGGKQVTAERRIRGDKSETWIQQLNGKEFGDNWKCLETGKTEVRKNVKLNEKSEFSYDLENGSTKVLRPDGTETEANKQGKWRVEKADGLVTEIEYSDGKTRKFHRKDGKLDSIEVKEPGEDGTVTKWQRVGNRKWKYDGKESDSDFSLSGDKYEYTDGDAGKKVTRYPDGTMREELPAERKVIDSKNGVINRIEINGDSRSFKRDQSGAVTGITDSATDITLTKQKDGTWISTKSNGEALEDSLGRKGTPVLGIDGRVSFLTEAGHIVTHDLGKKPIEIGHDSKLENKALKSNDLDEAAKIRFIESYDAFVARKDISAGEKTNTLREIDRMMTAEDSKIFSAKDIAKLGEQLMWHVSHAADDAQGQHPTCNVSDIRIAMERETPATLAKMIATVTTTGSFKTFDGNVINMSMLNMAPGPEEKRFPEDGCRSWVGKISDMTMANIHWQRRITDNKGRAVAQGSVIYDEVRPQGKEDSSSRLYHRSEQSEGWYRTELAKTPYIFADSIQDIYTQISGVDQTNRVVVHNTRNSGNGAAVIETKEQLEAQLRQGPWPKIVELQNNILQGKKPDGEDHEHVVVVVGYNKETGKVAVDNSHTKAQDMLTEDKQVSVQRLFDAMSAKATPPKPKKEDGYWQDGTYYQKEYGYYEKTGPDKKYYRGVVVNPQPPLPRAQANAAYQYRHGSYETSR